MYTRFDVVADAEGRAGAAALQDRLRYRPFLEAAEHFAAAHGLVVGGTAATRLLLGAPDDPAARPPLRLDSFQYDFYCSGVYAKAKALADALYALDPQGLGHYVSVLTKVGNYLLTVTVDGRELFTFIALPVVRGAATAGVLIPSRRPAQFASQGGGPLLLDCMGPEIQLMGVYAALCDPGAAGEWAGLLAAEASLRPLFEKEIAAKIAEAVASAGLHEDKMELREGGSETLAEALWSEPVLAQKASAASAVYFRALCARFVAGPGRVLIGPLATALFRGESPSFGRIQLVAAAPLETEAREAAALAQENGLEVRWAANDPGVPTDPRLRRLTLYLLEGARREPVLDLYNAAAHEPVPYVVADALKKGGARRAHRGATHHPRRDVRRLGPPAALPAATKVATPFAVMRFRLADMWTLQIMLRMGAIHGEFARDLMHGVLADYRDAAAYYEQMLASAPLDAAGAAARLLPLASYIGRREDAERTLRRETQASGRFYAPYFPAAEDQKNTG
jgi:tetratricopeptide (TPR) repeat protein